MSQQNRRLQMLGAGVVLLMAAALAADVAVNSTNLEILNGYADISGQAPSSTDSVLDVTLTDSQAAARAGGFYAPSTGTAVRGEAAGGTGVSGSSTGSYGVWGSSTNGWGGYFSSTNGYGLRVDTNGNDHYDHGAYITSQGGYAVYAQSASNMGVRGEAGDVTGIHQPLGPVGVVGLGVNRGMYGSSSSGVGVDAYSDSSYGVWGQSDTYRGVTGRTYRADNNYGFYTPDNLYSTNYHLLGAVMQVAYNGSGEEIEVGDVVVFDGILKPEKRRLTENGEPAPSAFNDEPVVRVARASDDSAGLVAGVVFSRYDLDAVDDSDLIEYDREGVDDPLERLHKECPPGAERPITPPGAVRPGEYLLVVVQGPARVRAGAAQSAIHVGDRLTIGEVPGIAAPLTARRIEGAAKRTERQPQLLGAALEPLVAGEEMIYAFVSPR